MIRVYHRIAGIHTEVWADSSFDPENRGLDAADFAEFHTTAIYYDTDEDKS